MKLKKPEKKYLLSVFSLAYFSGFLIFVLDRWVRVQSVVGEQHHPSERWVRMLHTAFTYLCVSALGYLFKVHIIPGLQAKKKRRVISGLGNLIFFIILVITALIIFYASEGDFRDYSTQIHLILGLASPLLILFHAVKRFHASR